MKEVGYEINTSISFDLYEHICDQVESCMSKEVIEQIDNHIVYEIEEKVSNVPNFSYWKEKFEERL